jgi:hypothetical protein
VAQDVGPEFKLPPIPQKKKKRSTEKAGREHGMEREERPN